jgi:glycosyltransferase involved in cell wall biosynthesis
MNRNRKKILFLCSWYPSEIRPTNGNFIQKHAESVQLNNDVTVLAIFSSKKDSEIRIEENENQVVREIIVYYPKKTILCIPNYFLHYKAFRLGLKKAEKHIGKIDLVHLNVIFPLGIWALWLKWFRKIPYVITEHSTFYISNSNCKKSKFRIWFARVILNQSFMTLPVSEDLGKSLKKISSKIPMQYISNVVDAKVFKLKSDKSNNNRSNFIHISTAIDKHKNVSGMIRVFSELYKTRTDFHLHFVSDEDIESLKILVNELKLDSVVTFYPTMSTDEIAKMITTSDALVLFSNYENFPCVIVESFMCGIPVISTNVNGIPEHVNSSNGILVNRGDEKELLQALNDFLDEKFTFNSIELRNYALKHFSYEEVSLKFNEVYEQVMRNNKN